MRVRISRCVVEAIQQAAAEAAPREACGILLGADGAITACQAADNTSETPETHFEIDPAALFAALRAERAGGPNIIGYWHSHPSGNPSPSARDAEMAVPDGKLWLIVSSGGMALWRPVERAIYDWHDHSVDSKGCAIPNPTPIGVMTGFDRVAAITGDVRDMLPHNKSDVVVVPLLEEAGYPAVAPYLDQLIAWTFDPNWPIAPPMAEWLSTLGAPVVEPLRRVLRGEDGDAKVNCMWGIARHLTPDLRAGLVDDLRALAERPSDNDRADEADACARALLAEWNTAE